MIAFLLRPRWILTSLLVAAALVVLVNLGLWQLDRLEMRRYFNARARAVMNQPVLDLNEDPDPNMGQMEYRQAVGVGTYDLERQFVLRNQVNGNLGGYHLITPLVLDGTGEVILVDRGWIPMEDREPATWAKYDQPGRVEVRGVLRPSFLQPRVGGVPDPTLAPGQRLVGRNYLTLPDVSRELGVELLPAYLQLAPAPGQAAANGAEIGIIPVAAPVEVDLSEGSHFGYAIQWFSFAGVLALGYPFFLRRQYRLQQGGDNQLRGALRTKHD